MFHERIIIHKGGLEPKCHHHVPTDATGRGNPQLLLTYPLTLSIQAGPDPPRDVTDMKRYSLLSRMSSIVSSEQTLTPFFINEENTSVFLNAVTGMFFPCCHTHLQPLGPEMAQSDPETYRWITNPFQSSSQCLPTGTGTMRGWKVFWRGKAKCTDDRCTASTASS